MAYKSKNTATGQYRGSWWVSDFYSRFYSCPKLQIPTRYIVIRMILEYLLVPGPNFLTSKIIKDLFWYLSTITKFIYIIY